MMRHVLDDKTGRTIIERGIYTSRSFQRAKWAPRSLLRSHENTFLFALDSAVNKFVVGLLTTISMCFTMSRRTPVL